MIVVDLIFNGRGTYAMATARRQERTIAITFMFGIGSSGIVFLDRMLFSLLSPAFKWNFPGAGNGLNDRQGRDCGFRRMLRNALIMHRAVNGLKANFCGFDRMKFDILGNSKK